MTATSIYPESSSSPTRADDGESRLRKKPVACTDIAGGMRRCRCDADPPTLVASCGTMPPVRSRLSTVLSVLSLVLFLATVGLLMQSGFSCQSISCPFRGGRIEAASARGRLGVARVFRSSADFAEWGFSRGQREPTLSGEILVNEDGDIAYDERSYLTEPNGQAGHIAYRWWYCVRTLRIRQTQFTGGVATAVYYVEYFSIPYWPLVLLFAIPPAWWVFVQSIRSSRRIERRHRRLCSACGYNLTGNTSGVCPECGTPTATGAKT